ncbi:TRAP transporter small permease [Salipaludibacillus sp. CUR1]|uniref:TRAP transporter small permease n=1 Tax=Salipaludibacillus sp. CUR1 TaxID=2820003 RepID=UPI001E59E405|nr:TRAP transporter small permease [Salipaludibacillus sp. CUR1]MCE7793189.1 TRAP transporter small permease [Salipaludibacillus sp. CUR1]
MLTKVTEKLVKLLSILCIITITALTIIVLVQVFSRYIRYSLPGTEELARLLVVWLTFLGSSLALHEKMHLSVSYFVNLAGQNMRQKISWLVHGLMILLFSILLIYGFRLTIFTMGSSSSTLQLPMGLFYMVIPISAIFSIYFIVVHMFEFPKKGENTA